MPRRPILPSLFRAALAVLLVAAVGGAGPLIKKESSGVHQFPDGVLPGPISPPFLFSQLASYTPPDGTEIFCSDCLLGSAPCSGGSTGATATRISGAWVCAGGGGGGGSGYGVIQNEGVPLTARPTVNFTGTSVDCFDNPGQFRTECSLTNLGDMLLGTPQTVTANKTFSTPAEIVFTSSEAAPVTPVPVPPVHKQRAM